MRNLRRILDSEVYFVTIRTTEERFALDPYACPGAWLEAEGKQLEPRVKLAMRARGHECIKETDKITAEIARSEQDESALRPVVPLATFTNSIPNIIGSCMARGLKMYGVKLYGFVWMSNHAHFLLRAPADKFADFMAYMNGQISVNANRFLGRKSQFWGRRYSAAQVLDEAAELEMLGYLLANPQNAGIADSIEQWAGLSSAAFFFQNSQQRFLHFNRTAWHKNGRPDDIAPFLSTTVLDHELLPQLSRLNERERQQLLLWAIDRQLKPSHDAGKKIEPIPANTIRRRFIARVVIPTERPESSKVNPRRNSPQPLCHTTKPSLRKLYREWHRAFRNAYKCSAEKYRSGHIGVVFPPGSFAPSKYPRAYYAIDPDVNAPLHPTRQNLEVANNLMALAS